MLEVIEKVNFATGCLGRQNVLALRHIPCFVDLPLMIDLYIKTNSGMLSTPDPVARLSLLVQSIIAVIFSVLRRFKWDFDLKFKLNSEIMNLYLR